MMKKHVTAKERISESAREAYKILRTNLQFGFPGDIRTITVTSSVHGEGKSRTALMLALALAESGLKVLLADADLRKPAGAKQRYADAPIGLSDLLAGYEPAEDAVRNAGHKNLYCLSSGHNPSNPSELLGTERFSKLLCYFTDQMKFEKIIIDTPPVCSVTDGTVIAAQTDGTILVIRCGGPDRAQVRRAKQQLEKLHVHMLGAVLNMMKKNDYSEYCV